MIRVYGWKPDRPDHRDLMFNDFLPQEALPRKVDLSGSLPSVWDQGELGSCTAQSVGAALSNALISARRLTLEQANKSSGVPSRLFIYFNERMYQGTIGIDSGATIRDGIRSLVRYGACFENVWPYNISQFWRRPGVVAYKQAVQQVIRVYRRIGVTDGFGKKSALASGLPISFGMAVYESFESEEVGKTGLVPIPDRGESALGGHAQLIVGYDDDMVINGLMGAYMVRNSWGGDWGLDGHCFIPYAYLDNGDLADDFWVVQK
jgi:C1A family cysteine protease